MKVKRCEDCENLIGQVRASLNRGSVMEAALIQSYFEAHYYAVHRKGGGHDTMAFQGFAPQRVTELPGGQN